MRYPRGVCLFLLATLSVAAATAPADLLPTPTPERCVGFIPSVDEDGEMSQPQGLNYEQVSGALNTVIQTALRCPRPANRKTLALTFSLNVGCDGIISHVAVVDDDNAPADYLSCVSAVIEKADFPAHDMAEGMPVTYPVNVSW